MAIFKVNVVKEKTWTERSEGTAYIEASSLQQAQKKAKRINRAIRNADYDLSEFSDIEFDEGNSVLININDFEDDDGKQSEMLNLEELKSSGEEPDDTSFELGEVTELTETFDKVKLSTLDVPDPSPDW